MIIDSVSKDLGVIKVGIPHKFSYTLTAEGFSVKFKEVYTGCGSCTTANIEKGEIDPNEEVVLNVTFQPQVCGVQTKKVFLKYEENEDTIKKEFTFTANVIK